ncbi:MAG: DUF2225 domain-containing protein [Lachnospiraceae bacterium]|nr:DUF2225 domain-containing protein [Lachnospiraceae bacterium]
MGLFSGLEQFGLGKYNDAKLMEEKKEDNTLINAGENQGPKVREEDVLYDKRYTCPVCDISFTSKTVRAGKIKLVSKDTDLRAVYEIADPHKYDVIACENCGYSAVGRYFGKLSTRQMRDIKDQVGTNFRGISNDKELFSYDDAILRYKLALVCSIVKHAKNSEKGYTSLKMAWVLRGKRLTLKPGDTAILQLYEEEMECIANAYACFVEALANEMMPIAGMDENTIKYLMAELARKLKKYDDSAKLLAEVITSKATPARLKEEALNVKALLKEDIKKNGRA